MKLLLRAGLIFLAVVATALGAAAAASEIHQIVLDGAESSASSAAAVNQ
jgi:hypothetical protein